MVLGFDLKEDEWMSKQEASWWHKCGDDDLLFEMLLMLRMFLLVMMSLLC